MAKKTKSVKVKEELPKSKPSKKSAGRPKSKQQTKKEEIEVLSDVENQTENKLETHTLIYGNEQPKQVVAFPQSDLQLQTKNLIKEYGINISLIPQNIVDSLNSLVQDFSIFVTNPNQFNLIGGIMDKDLVTANLI